MNKDSLGDRMKRYESVTNATLVSRIPVILRVDGKAFHTFTRDMGKPFDHRLISAMVNAAKHTANNMQGFILAYVQSDEVTFVINNDREIETQPWFNNEVLKLTSITASLFTGYFNHIMGTNLSGAIAAFDCRVFQMPEDDVPNNFIWRQRDWERNSIQMLARHHFSHKELQNKSAYMMIGMLQDKGVEWSQLEDQLKYGTFITRNLDSICRHFDYYELKEMIEGSQW